MQIIDDNLSLGEFRTIHAHATMIVQWSAAAIKRLESGKSPKPKKVKGLTAEKRASVEAHLRKTMFKK